MRYLESKPRALRNLNDNLMLDYCRVRVARALTAVEQGFDCVLPHWGASPRVQTVKVPDA
jgi:hypothetical protein